MAAMLAGVLMPAVGLGDVIVDLAIGAVLFVVVVTVTAVLMFILQAVLPGGDAGDGQPPIEDGDDRGDTEPAPPRAASGG
jgi:hypothetical protein